MSVIRWEKPPSTQHRDMRWKAIADELKAHPGEWALVAEDLAFHEAHRNLRKKLMKYEITVSVRKMGEGTFSAWGCYLPTPDQQVSPL